VLPAGFARQLRAAMANLDKFVFDFIERRSGEPPREDMISVLLAARDEAGAPLSRQQIRDEIVTMFFAGHETGAASISWTLFLLAYLVVIAVGFYLLRPASMTLGHG